MLGGLRSIGSICGFQLRLELIEVLAGPGTLFVWLLGHGAIIPRLRAFPRS